MTEILSAPSPVIRGNEEVEALGLSNEPLKYQLAAVLFQHRLVTAEQLRQMLTPTTGTHAYLRRRLRELKGLGLVGSVKVHPSGQWVWFLTEAGLEQAATWSKAPAQRPKYALTTKTAASLWHAHALATVDVGLAFLCSARQRGDEFTPLDWTPEVTHCIRDGAERTAEDMLRADALLHYTLNEPSGERIQLRAFLEVDRGTMSSERVASKLICYARFFEHVPTGGRGINAGPATPAWQRIYPRFPRILFVLTGSGPVALHRRISDLQAMTEGHPQVTRMAEQVPMGATTLKLLDRHGPFAPVWTPLYEGKPCSWTEL